METEGGKYSEASFWECWGVTVAVHKLVGKCLGCRITLSRAARNRWVCSEGTG